MGCVLIVLVRYLSWIYRFYCLLLVCVFDCVFWGLCCGIYERGLC